MVYMNYFVVLVGIVNVYCKNDPNIAQNYPWQLGEFGSRQNQILDTLLNSISVDIYKNDDSDDSLKNMRFRNLVGKSYVCSKFNEEDTLTNIFENDIPLQLGDKLDSVCLGFVQEYWNYEWCHRTEFKQFHVQKGRGKKIIRDPEWSLGTYTKSEVKYDINGKFEAIIDIYEGGQFCDENSDHRSTEVHLSCCDSTTTTTDPLHIATITGFSEPYTCHYRLDICTYFLCPTKPLPSVPQVAVSPSVLEVISGMSAGLCMSRQEEWWTYEICFSYDKYSLLDQKNTKARTSPSKATVESGVRQFRLTTLMEQEKDTIKSTNIKDPIFNLGVPPPYLNEDNERLMKDIYCGNYRLSNISEPCLSPSLRVEYGHGSVCDIDNMTRASTVIFTCGERDEILDIFEDRTCHYIVKVSLRSLCKVELFVPKESKKSRILCSEEE